MNKKTMQEMKARTKAHVARVKASGLTQTAQSAVGTIVTETLAYFILMVAYTFEGVANEERNAALRLAIDSIKGGLADAAELADDEEVVQ